jgi:hypothetical protein
MSEHVSSHRIASSRALQTLPATVSHLIAIRAHELYELRRKRDGHALEDWLQAESEILSSALTRSFGRRVHSAAFCGGIRRAPKQVRM